MFRRTRAFVFAFIAALMPTIACAQSEIKTQQVAFKDGLATIKGRVKGYATMDYVFPTGAGESIKVSLKTNKGGNYFNLNPAGSEEAIFIGSSLGSTYSGVAPMSGDYRARVYLMRNEARRGTAANFTLTIAVGQKSATDEKGPDFADGLIGGPDYWEVKGVAPGDGLSLRAAPSPKGKLLTQFPSGAVLKNLGCKNTRGQRWCRVEQPGEPRRGWVNGRHLKESGAPK